LVFRLALAINKFLPDFERAFTARFTQGAKDAKIEILGWSTRNHDQPNHTALQAKNQTLGNHHFVPIQEIDQIPPAPFSKGGDGGNTFHFPARRPDVILESPAL
jgi:hypothetical protein